MIAHADREKIVSDADLADDRRAQLARRRAGDAAPHAGVDPTSRTTPAEKGYGHGV